MGTKDDAVIADETAARAAVLEDEAALFASPLPLTGERKTTTRKELWVRTGWSESDLCLGISIMLATPD